MIKDALAIVDGSPRCHAAIDATIEFAQHHLAQLAISILFEQVPAIALTDPMNYAMALEANCELQAGELSTIRDELAEVAPGVAMTSACMDPAAFPAAACRQGLTVDLALIGPSSSWCNATARRQIVESLIVRAGTPTLVFPSEWQPSLFTHAVLGWNGSPEASRAARTLTSLLEPGAVIDVLMVDEGRLSGDSATDSQDAIGAHLARHDFDVSIHRRTMKDRSTVDILQEFAKSRSAQLLAVGGYSHSRLREGLFGGVTRSLVESADVPVLFAG